MNTQLKVMKMFTKVCPRNGDRD